jgi:hypothetical protein
MVDVVEGACSAAGVGVAVAGPAAGSCGAPGDGVAVPAVRAEGAVWAGTASGVLADGVWGTSLGAEFDGNSWPATPLPGPVWTGAGVPDLGTSSLVTSRPATTRTTPAAAIVMRKMRRPLSDHPSVDSGWGLALSVLARISSGRCRPGAAGS